MLAQAQGLAISSANYSTPNPMHPIPSLTHPQPKLIPSQQFDLASHLGTFLLGGVVTNRY